MKKLILFLLALIFTHISYISAQPSSPLLENPPKGTDVVVLPAVLDWNDVSGADCYFFEVLTDTLNKTFNWFCMSTTSSFQVTSADLNPGVKYYWRVVAHNSEGWGTPSQFYDFTTAEESADGSLENLSDGVIDLIAEEDIPLNQGNILLNRLEHASNRLENQEYFLASLNMYLFKIRITILRMSGQISASTFDELNYSTDGVIDLISDIQGRPTVFNNNTLQPEKYSLAQNYPNPFNPSTTIEYSIPQNSFVSLKIYDMTGREISTLVSKQQETGTYIVDWNASKLSSGVYFYRLNAGNFTETKKMILAK
jgi:hypothetical protein